MSAMAQQREQDLHEAMLQIWQARLSILAGVVCAAVLAGGWLALANPHYSAAMIVGPVARMTGANLTTGDMFPGFQRDTERPGSPDDRDFTRFENIVTGPSVAARLFADKDILRGVEADTALRFVQGDTPGTPGQMADYIARHVKIQPVGSSNLRRITYTHPDGDFAAVFLQKLHDAADDLIRADAGRSTRSRMAYLEKQLEETDNPDHRRALTAMLMEQENIGMMVNMDEPYAAALAEPPAASAKPVWPDRKIVLPVAVFIGAFLGFLVSGFRRRA